MTSAIAELTIPTPDHEPMIAAEAALSAVNSMAITSQADHEHAASELKEIKQRAADMEAVRKSLVAPLNEAHARIQELFRQPLKYLADAERIIKTKMVDYLQAEQRKAREIAAAEEARLRKLAEQRAERAEKRGDADAAAGHRVTAEMTVVPVAAPPTVAGISTRSIWRAEVTNIKELCRAIADGLVPVSLVTVNQTEANRMASALKDTMKVPGLRSVESTSVAARR